MLNLIEEFIRRDRMTAARVLVVGDGMTDVYIKGQASPCQDGCQKFIPDNKAVVVPGGASNAARSLENWNADVLFPLAGLYQHDGPIKTRYMDGARCVFRHDDDAVNFDLELARAELEVVLKTCRPHAVLISDYDKGLLTPEFLAKVIWHCRRINVPCVVDAKREPSLYAGAIIKCNQNYQKRFYGLLPFDRMVVTYGSQFPVTWISRTPYGQKDDKKPLPPVRCVNHVGAGDCFAAHLTLALAYNFPLEDASRIAHSAGRCYVQKPYNEPPCLEDIAADSRL